MDNATHQGPFYPRPAVPGGEGKPPLFSPRGETRFISIAEAVPEASETFPAPRPESCIDSIYIISRTLGAAEQIQEAIRLRGFEEIKCFSLETLQRVEAPMPWPLNHPPELMIIDAAEQEEAAVRYLETLPESIPVIFLADAFDEEVFIHCFDRGARDFLVKPVNLAYLVSRILMILENQRLKHQLKQHHEILKDLSAVSAETEIFSAGYFIRIMERQVSDHARLRGTKPGQADELVLLLITLEGLPEDPLFRQAALRRIAAMISQCCRGLDLPGEYYVGETVGFGILLPQTGLRGGEVVSGRLKKQLDGRELAWGSQSIRLGLRIAIADSTGCMTSGDLIRKALGASDISPPDVARSEFKNDLK